MTCDPLRSDLALLYPDNTLYLPEHTIGFETNIEKNSNLKATKYKPLFHDLNFRYHSVYLANLSMNALGTFDSSSDSVMTMMDDLGLTTRTAIKLSRKSSNSLFDTFYVFCLKNKAWTNLELLEF